VRKLAVLLALTASCSGGPQVTEGARKAFEDWAKAAASGDAEKTLAGFSDAKKSDWLYDRLTENDPLAKLWRGDLTGEARTQLDLWWGNSLKHGNGRDEPLRDIVLTHPSFVQLFRQYFIREAKSIQTGLARAEVTTTYGDSTGVTVLVKSGPGAPVEYYGMIFEGNGWKIDAYKPPQQGGK